MSPVDKERRGADRARLPEPLEATISGVPVRVVELSGIGARVEHEDRFPLNAPSFRLTWRGMSMTVPVQVARAEISGKRGSRLVYQCGIQFAALDTAAQGLIAAVLQWAEGRSEEKAAAGAVVAEEPQPVGVMAGVAEAAPRLDDSWRRRGEQQKTNEPPSDPGEDTWTRRVRFLKDDLDEDDLPYAQFRLTDSGWEKSYVGSPVQPQDGFTLARTDLDFAEIQRSFEFADPDTRRMIQIALESKLAGK